MLAVTPALSFSTTFGGVAVVIVVTAFAMVEFATVAALRPLPC